MINRVLRNLIALCLLLAATSATAGTDKPAYVVDGKPFFPIGLYRGASAKVVEMAQQDPAVSIESTDQLIQMLKDRSFNCVISNPTDQESLTAFANNGLYCIASAGAFRTPESRDVYSTDAIQATVKSLGPHRDRILAWYISDEPPENEWPRIRTNRTTINQTLPKASIFSTCCIKEHVAQIGELCDVLGIDPYPLFQPTTNSLRIDDVSAWYDIANKATDTPIIGIPQCFAADDVWREPTPHELTCMVYQHLIGGAKGLLYYASYSGEQYSQMPPHQRWFLPRSPLWNHLKPLNKEVAALEQVWLAPRINPLVNCANPAVRFACKQLKDITYLVAVNTSRHPQDVVFYASGIESVERAFEQEDVVVTRMGLRDTFEPLQRHVYRISGDPRPVSPTLSVSCSQAEAGPGDSVELTVSGADNATLSTSEGGTLEKLDDTSCSLRIATDKPLDEVYVTAESEGEVVTARVLVSSVLDASVSRVFPKHVYSGGKSDIELQVSGMLARIPGLQARLATSPLFQRNTGWTDLKPSGGDSTCLLHSPLGEETVGTHTGIVEFRFPNGSTASVPARFCAPWRLAKCDGALQIDGDFADWKTEPIHVIRERDRNGFGRPYRGEADLSLDIRGAWDKDYLYLAVGVTDDYNVVHQGPPDEIWQGDSVQFGFDAANDASASSRAYDSNDCELGAGQGPDGVVVWRWVRNGEWDRGLESEVKAAITRSGSVTCYEIAFPWQALGIERAEKGRDFALTISANDADPELPRRALQWGGSIVGPKFTGDFIDVVLQ